MNSQSLTLLVFCTSVPLTCSDSLNYLGCYLKDEFPILKESRNSENGTVQFSAPFIFSETNIPGASSSDLDLWFTPVGHTLSISKDPHQCVDICKQNSFRYAGIYSALGSLKCICGSNYGRFGTGQCLPCLKLESAAEEIYCGSTDSTSIYDTGFKVPSVPQKILLMNRGENTLGIRWTKPIATNGPLTAYHIHINALFTYSNYPQALQHREWRVSDVDQELLLTGLSSGTEYNVSLQAVNSEGPSLPVTVTLWTKIGAPDVPPPPEVIEQDSKSMIIHIFPTKNSKGPLSKYRILLIDDSRLGFFSKDRNTTWNESMTIGYPQYIAAEFHPDEFPRNGRFVIGDGKFYGQFYNGPIPEGHWHPSLGILSTMQGVTEISYSATSHDQHQFLLPGVVGQDTPNVYQDTSNRVEKSKDDRRAEIIITENSVVVTALWISIGVGVTILLVCVSIYSILKLELVPKRSNSRRPSYPPPFSRAFPEERPTELTCRTSVDSPYIFPDELSGGYTHSGFIPDEDLKSRVLDKLKQVWYIPRNFMAIPGDDDDLVQLVGKGTYGSVHLSTIKSTNDKTNTVRLYTIPDSFLKQDDKSRVVESAEKFFIDLSDLASIDPHENVVRLIGFMEDGDSFLFAIEFAGVPLKEWLLDYRKQISSHISHSCPIESKMSYSFLLCAMNIAEAMFHLSSFKITHRELAACNVLVSNIEVPKITGFGMLKMDSPSHEKDYTRWFALELFQNRCIKPCDLWSFGVLLWELTTIGATPYYDIRKEDLSKRICRGSRPQQIEVIGDPLYQIMLHCWQIDRDERPDFGSLSCSIHELLPHSKESLFISPSFNYPPYIFDYEHK